jgi:hypothetical protein
VDAPNLPLLESVQLYDHQDILVKKFEFVYGEAGYSDIGIGSGVDVRNILTAVIERNENLEIVDQLIFEYKNDGEAIEFWPIPEEGIWVDNWGYYNPAPDPLRYCLR